MNAYTACECSKGTLVSTYHQVLIVSVFNEGEEAVVLPVLPHHQMEIHTIGYSSLPVLQRWVNIVKLSCC